MLFLGEPVYILRTVPADWLNDLPWPKIGAAAGSALLVAAGGIWTKDTVDQKVETAGASLTVQQEHMLKHYDWQTSCPVVAEDQAEGAQLRKCGDDDCRMFIIVRNGLRQVFFAVAPAEVPKAPMLLGVVDLPGQPVYAAWPATCKADHGPPSADPPLVDGADLGNGWIWQHMLWRDGCRMSRQFHRPTQAATAWAWDICYEVHS